VQASNMRQTGYGGCSHTVVGMIKVLNAQVFSPGAITLKQCCTEQSSRNFCGYSALQKCENLPASEMRYGLVFHVSHR